VNWAAFVPSWIASTEFFYDLTGTLTYLTVTAFALVAVGRYDTRSLLLSALVVIWATRLGSFLFTRVRADGGDGRFDEILIDPARLFMTWTLQGLWVFLTLAAALGAITASTAAPLGWTVLAGTAIWAVGFTIEVTADYQKRAFRSEPNLKLPFITTGVWAWSRHPNYFGEITLWVGVALIAVGGLQGWRYITLISPIFVWLLITRVSGIPMLEARAKKRWGDDPEFQEYTRNTPSLIPRPPRVR
jgi:steroid 5-alpha reductase family enzyme